MISLLLYFKKFSLNTNYASNFTTVTLVIYMSSPSPLSSGVAKSGPGKALALPSTCCALPLGYKLKLRRKLFGILVGAQVELWKI